MLDYYINLLEDAIDFSWSSAKARHAVILCCMKQGEIGSRLETDTINRIRRAHAQRHVTAHTSSLQLKKATRVANMFPVCIITRILEYKRALIRLNGSYINKYVQLVGPKMANILHTLSQNAESIRPSQETSNSGHAFCWS